jgi:ferredoxin
MPEIFILEEKYAKVKLKVVDDALYEKLRALIKDCPADAIELSEK